ncbi:MAG TPA: hypothetical protein VIQ31_37925, partial [Phormidium sp.]
MATSITPPANRGLNSQNVHSDTKDTDQRFHVGIDWLQGTIPITSHGDVISFIDFVEMAFKDSLVLEVGTRTKHGRIWSNSAQGAAGSLLAWNLPGEMNDNGSLWFSFGGSVLSRSGSTKSHQLLVKALRE